MTIDSRTPGVGMGHGQSDAAQKDVWEKPEIVSCTPAKNAQGINFRPSDGISNLTA